MRLSQLGFVFREAFRGVRQNGLMSMASVTTITISLTLLALFLLVALNLQYLTVVDKVQAVPGVVEVQYITREQALEDLKEQFGERSDLLATMEGDANPLRDSIHVRAEEPARIPLIAEEVMRLESVAEVKYGTEVVDRIVQFSEMLRQGGLVLIGVMVLTTILLIANTTRLTVFARRREIQVMKLVGATNGIIRWPFLLEGVFLGLIGAMLASAITWYAYSLVSTEITFTLPFFPVLPLQPMLTNLTKLLLGAGVILGGFGSTLSVRRYVRV